MRMTKIGMAAAICGLILAGVGTTNAQGTGAKGKHAQAASAKALKKTEGKHQGRLAELLAKLNLTPEQKKQVAAIEDGAKKQALSIQQNAALSAEDKKTQEKTLGKDTRKQIAAVLTPAQKQQLKQMAAERRRKVGDQGTPAAPSAVTPAAPAASPASKPAP